MIVTVKLGNLDYRTFAIDLGNKYFDDDTDYLKHLNECIREHLWNNEFDLQDKQQYYNDYSKFIAPPIVMMYSRNHYHYGNG